MTLQLEALFIGPLRGVTVRLEPGVHCVIGSPAEGTGVLVDVCSGFRPPKRGTVRLGDHEPYREPEVRRRIGTVLAIESVGNRGTVTEAVESAAQLRGDRIDVASALGTVGIESWSRRDVSTLEPAEAQAVALAIALSVATPQLLVLYEPLASWRAATPLGEILAERAASAVVLCTTSSLRDARELVSGHPDALFRLEGGGLRPTTTARLADGAELIVRTPAARELAAALLDDAGIEGVECHVQDDAVRVRGSSVDVASLALAKAATQHSIRIEAIEPILPGFDALYARAAGRARAEYEAAYQRQRAQPAAAAPGPSNVWSTPPQVPSVVPVPAAPPSPVPSAVPAPAATPAPVPTSPASATSPASVTPAPIAPQPPSRPTDSESPKGSA